PPGDRACGPPWEHSFAYEFESAVSWHFAVLRALCGPSAIRSSFLAAQSLIGFSGIFFLTPIFHIPFTFHYVRLSLLAHPGRRMTNWAKTWSPSGFFLPRGSANTRNVSHRSSWRSETLALRRRTWFASLPFFRPTVNSFHGPRD